MATDGSFYWNELMTRDAEAAKKFYGGLFGWSASDAPMGPDAFYTMFQLRVRNVGAAYALMPDQIQARSLSISANTVNSLRTALLKM